MRSSAAAGCRFSWPRFAKRVRASIEGGAAALPVAAAASERDAPGGRCARRFFVASYARAWSARQPVERT
jgi:hypothetical protein